MLLKSFKQLFRKPKIKSSAWDASSSGRRLLHFQPESGSINNLLSQSLEHLRSRSRDMVRKNSYAANIIDTIVSNSVGTGIKPQSKAKDAEFRKKIQELWLRWTDEADSSGVSDFYGLQALVCRSMIEGGECFVRLRTRKREDGLCVPLQLQVLESEHLDKMTSITEGNNLGDLLKYEASNLYSRDQITVAKGQNLKLGTVVGRDKDDLIKIINPTATDGTQTAIGVITSDVNATKAVIITRIAMLADHAVVWPANITEEQKAAAISNLTHVVSSSAKGLKSPTNY